MTNCSATQIERESVVEGSTKWFVHVVKLEKQKLRLRRQVFIKLFSFKSGGFFEASKKKSRLTFFPRIKIYSVHLNYSHCQA